MLIVESSTLGLFAGAVLLLLMSPAPNMAFVIAHGATYGWRGGVAAALGIGAADLVLTAFTAAGFTAVIAQWPPSFDLLRVAGALYLLWMAYKAIRSPAFLPAHSSLQPSLASVFVRATMNSLLNAKALLFFMVFLPQFVDRGTTHVAQQLVVLGMVLTVIAIAFHAALGLLGGTVRSLVSQEGRSAQWQSRGMAIVLVLLALRLAMTSRPG